MTTFELNEDLYRDEWRWQEGDLTVTRSTQWSAPGCHMGCGILLYTDKDGKLVKVEGDPKNNVNGGRLCMRCLAMLDAIYDPNRILYPIKRDPKDRGKDAWERITWDEAYDLIEEKVRYFQKEYGARSIVGFGGTGRNAMWQYSVLAHAVFDSCNDALAFQSGEACYVPRVMAAQALAGGTLLADCSQFLKDRYDAEDYVQPELIILWGNEPEISSSDGFFGPWVTDLMKKGTKLITVDPRITWMGARAEYVLQLRPGTDGAVALGLIHVMINEDLYDHEFVEKWTYGFDELVERAQDWTPEKVEEITGVPADKIRGAARLWAASKPAALQWGLALDQQKYALGAAHGALCCQALTGNIDNPGGLVICDVGYVQDDIRRTFMNAVPREVMKGKLGDEDYVLRRIGYSPHAQSDAVLVAMETDEPYPLKMSWFQGTNPIACQGADNLRVYNALSRMEFNVDCNYVFTPTNMAVCDLILPIAMGPERDGIRGWWTPLRAINKVTQTGEAKNDDQIVLELGKRFHPERFPWADVEEMTDHICNNINSMNYNDGFAKLRESVFVYPEWHYYKYEKGLLRADGQPGFNTPTGRLEFFCTLYDEAELDPLPHFHEPPTGPVSTPELMEQFPYILTTGRRAFEFFHSEHRHLESMREFHPYPVVEIHPDDAKKEGIEEGDWVELENKIGKARFKARLYEGLRPGMVMAEHGWWFPEKDPESPSLFGVFESNSNRLTPECDIGPSSYGAPYKCQICSVTKV